jgi:tetratricopeptide (TPR) repeat protein
MRNWKIAGFIATLVIGLSMPLYLARVHFLGKPSATLMPERLAGFVGSEKCKSCHKREYDLWKGSHHDLAMDVASDETMLGDFNDATLEHHGVVSRFYRRDGRFYAHTPGPDGEMGDFELTHTFGWYPLQQYLVPFPGGRYQCLPIAWDVDKKRWYHLYPDTPINPDDWLYWTNAGQNWNGMCAECHSTNLKKNYDVDTDSYQTTWSDIDVGCEACHGPGSRHVEWAELPDMARPPVKNVELVVQTSGLTSRSLVELCAPCHSRRAALGDYTHAEPDLLDSTLPQALNEGLYFADGQILDEVYVYGSFTQSKMYHRDVRCSDCHEAHSIRPVREGNDLCLQCHRAQAYDTREHHFHKKKGEQGEAIKSADGTVLFEVGTGAECVQCHMPGRVYMGIDYRPDHSFRLPRPDQSVKLGVPNACNRCHIDKTAQWSDEAITKWYGPGRRPHYGTIIDQGRKQEPEARDELIRLAGDTLYPVIVRSTALGLLDAYPAEETTKALELALMDEEALIRRTALDSLNVSDPQSRRKLISPMLYDPVKAVRIEAARLLAEDPSLQLGPTLRKVYEATLEEYKASMDYSADFAFARYNLANLYVSLGQPDKAVRSFRAAIKIDDLFYPAKVNLAMLYDQRGEKKKAEVLLREVLEADPDMHEVAYSLGLLLAEEKRYEEAAVYLQKAAQGMPQRARIHYNLGLLLQLLGRDSEAEEELLAALRIEPNNIDFLYAAADHYLKRGRLSEAKRMAETMIEKHPSNRLGHDLLGFINSRMQE